MPPRGYYKRFEIMQADRIRVMNKLYERGYRIVIQWMPAQPARGMPPTTCRHCECPNEHSMILPGDFRASIEKLDQCDPQRIVGFEPQATLDEVRRSKLGPSGLYGRGKEGQEWWCLNCLEELLPLSEFLDWIIPEQRSAPQYPGAYTLPSHLAYALEKSKAVKKCDDVRSTEGNCVWDGPTMTQKKLRRLYSGDDGESMYVSLSVRDARGVLPTGQIVEVNASDVRGLPLSVALTRAILLVTRPAAPVVQQQQIPATTPIIHHHQTQPAAPVISQQQTLPAATRPRNRRMRQQYDSRGVPIVRTAEDTPPNSRSNSEERLLGYVRRRAPSQPKSKIMRGPDLPRVRSKDSDAHEATNHPHRDPPTTEQAMLGTAEDVLASDDQIISLLDPVQTRVDTAPNIVDSIPHSLSKPEEIGLFYPNGKVIKGTVGPTEGMVAISSPPATGIVHEHAYNSQHKATKAIASTARHSSAVRRNDSEPTVMGKNQKNFTKAFQMVYSDNEISPEEKMAKLPHYTYDWRTARLPTSTATQVTPAANAAAPDTTTASASGLQIAQQLAAPNAYEQFKPATKRDRESMELTIEVAGDHANEQGSVTEERAAKRGKG